MSAECDLLAIGPHPDDVELGCGGTIIKHVELGYRIVVADLTSGGLGTRGDAETRLKEAAEAAGVMGVQERVQLGLCEGSLLAVPQNMQRIVSLIRRFKPEVILAPLGDDRHPDHNDASTLIQRACFMAGLSKFGDSLPAHRPKRLIYYFLYRERTVSMVTDISNQFERKMEAVRAYRSQFGAASDDDRQTFISKPEFLSRVETRSKYYGEKIGVKYGEPFFLREMPSVNNLIAWAREQGYVG